MIPLKHTAVTNMGSVNHLFKKSRRSNKEPPRAYFMTFAGQNVSQTIIKIDGK